VCFATPGHPDQWAGRLKRVFDIDIARNWSADAKPLL